MEQTPETERRQQFNAIYEKMANNMSTLATMFHSVRPRYEHKEAMGYRPSRLPIYFPEKWSDVKPKANVASFYLTDFANLPIRDEIAYVQQLTGPGMENHLASMSKTLPEESVEQFEIIIETLRECAAQLLDMDPDGKMADEMSRELLLLDKDGLPIEPIKETPVNSIEAMTSAGELFDMCQELTTILGYISPENMERLHFFRREIIILTTMPVDGILDPVRMIRAATSILSDNSFWKTLHELLPQHKVRIADFRHRLDAFDELNGDIMAGNQRMAAHRSISENKG